MARTHLLALAAAAAASLASGQGTCSFGRNGLTCPGPGSACCADTTNVADSGSRAGMKTYTPAYCHVESGHNTTTWCGHVATTPDMEEAYRMGCNPSAKYQCQHVDPTLLGEEHFPGTLRCVVNRCILSKKQESGDPCSENSECLSSQCTKGVCIGLPIGDTCTLGGCEPGLYCNTAAVGGPACQAVSKAGQACTEMSQCEAGTLCNMALPTAVCQAMFSNVAGIKVNTPDLCVSGVVDTNNQCVAIPAAAIIGNPCQTCGDNTGLPPGTQCMCASDGHCRIRGVTYRTAGMVAARQAARKCFLTATAPNGMPCTDPWTNIGYGARDTDTGTCGYLKCHKEVLAWYGAEGETLVAPYLQFDHDTTCAQTVFNAFYASAIAGHVGCQLPDVWRRNGWTCNSEPPAAAPGGMSGGAAFGVAVAVLLPLGLCGWAGYKLKKGTAPSWLSNTAASVTGVFKRGGSYSSVAGKGTGSGTSSSMGSAYVYTSSGGGSEKLTGSGGGYGAT